MSGLYLILLIAAALFGISILLTDPDSVKKWPKKNENSEYCEFSLQELSIPGPLILHANKPEILYPDSKNKIHVYKGNEIRLSCVNANFTTNEITSSSDIIVSCDRENQFKFGSSYFNIHQFKCKDFPKSVSKIIGTCFENNTKIQIGFELGQNFIPVYFVCFDEKSKNTIYSSYNSKLTQGFQSKVNRPYFTQSPEYGNLSVNYLYSMKNQLESFNKTLGSMKLSHKYITKSNFISRGHLSPKADFVYSFEQAATFHYLNVAPQWLKFNAGNWEKLESKIRNVILNETCGYTVVTGTYHVGQLQDVNGIEKYLYLNHTESLLPIVKYFWKIIYKNDNEDDATVFVGVNNPHLKKINRNYILCNQTTDNYKWINFNTSDIVSGYLYSCDIKQFFNVTGYNMQLFQ